MPHEAPSESSCRARKSPESTMPLAHTHAAAADSPWRVTCCSPSNQTQQQQPWPAADGSCAASCCKRAATPAGKENHVAQTQAGQDPQCRQGQVAEPSCGVAPQPLAQSSAPPSPSGCSGAARESRHDQPQDMPGGGAGQLKGGQRGQGRGAGWDPPALVRVDESAPLRALCGVRIVWASVEARRQGIASKLLDLARWRIAPPPLISPPLHISGIKASMGL